jgi:hypothetical protein
VETLGSQRFSAGPSPSDGTIARRRQTVMRKGLTRPVHRRTVQGPWTGAPSALRSGRLDVSGRPWVHSRQRACPFPERTGACHLDASPGRPCLRLVRMGLRWPDWVAQCGPSRRRLPQARITLHHAPRPFLHFAGGAQRRPSSAGAEISTGVRRTSSVDPREDGCSLRIGRFPFGQETFA